MRNMDKDSLSNLTGMIKNSPVPFIICNPRLDDNPIVACNTAFVELTGYDESEIIGHNCRFLSGADTDPEHTQTIVNAVKNHEPLLIQLLNYKKDGTTFRNALMIAPIFDDEDQLAYFLGSQMEIAETYDYISSERQVAAIKLVELLSPQQKRVLAQVAKGYRNKQIAHNLQISVSTVKMHRAEALAKMNLSTSAEAIRVAVEAGL